MVSILIMLYYKDHHHLQYLGKVHKSFVTDSLPFETVCEMIHRLWVQEHLGRKSESLNLYTIYCYLDLWLMRGPHISSDSVV